MGIIGTGWCGGIRAETCARHPLIKSLHIAETRPERLAEMTKLVNPATATADFRQIIDNKNIDAVMISATPETLHYPMARDALNSGKHVFLEKPIAIELHEADDLIHIAKKNNLKFTIGYSQRFNPKFAYVKQCIEDGPIGVEVLNEYMRKWPIDVAAEEAGRTRAVSVHAIWAISHVPARTATGVVDSLRRRSASGRAMTMTSRTATTNTSQPGESDLLSNTVTSASSWRGPGRRCQPGTGIATAGSYLAFSAS